MTGQLLEIHRFPVKSMLGESVSETDVGASGLVGDRAHALVDCVTNKVASAKHPQLWAKMLELRAMFRGEAVSGAPVAVRMADGTEIRSDDPEVHRQLSQAVGRAVRLVAAPPPAAVYDDVWPDIEGLAPQPFIDATQTAVTDAGRPISTLPVAPLAPGTFQDFAPITLMTTAALRTVSRLCPASSWDARRFRPNFIVEVDGEGFVENEWSGRRLEIGDVVLEIISPTPRCVMTTLAQEELPGDINILRTIARHNRVEFAAVGGKFACLGAYASVIHGGRTAIGAAVRLV